jgi:hypothetical protein
MPGEIGTVTADGLSLYATIQALNKNNFWTTGDTFEAFNAAHWANYSTLGLTELTGSNGTYVANFPTGITTADEYTVVVRQKVGGSNAVTDPVVAIGTVTWSGTAAETLLSPPTLAAIQAGLPTDSSIAADVQTGLTAQGFTAARAGYLDVLNGVVADIWSAATRTLTAFGFTPVVSGIAGTTLPAAVPSLAQIRNVCMAYCVPGTDPSLTASWTKAGIMYPTPSWITPNDAGAPNVWYGTGPDGSANARWLQTDVGSAQGYRYSSMAWAKYNGSGWGSFTDLGIIVYPKAAKTWESVATFGAVPVGIQIFTDYSASPQFYIMYTGQNSLAIGLVNNAAIGLGYLTAPIAASQAGFFFAG